MRLSIYPLTFALCILAALAFGQATPAVTQSAGASAAERPKEAFVYKPLQVNLDDSGSRYLRFIIWHQQWFQTNNLANDAQNFAVNTLARRSRFLAYAQMSPRLLILTHIGLNNMDVNNMTSLGNNGDGPQFFLHDAWTEYKVSAGEELYLGTGLHYWKGLTRLASASTLNFMTMDQSRPFAAWHSLGVSDQFARHLGLYGKGRLGKLDYRVAINQPITGPTAITANFSNIARTVDTDSITYTGARPRATDENTQGRWLTEAYVEYAFGDRESIKLPYRVGSYLGAKRVINVGAGFFLHPNGVYNNTQDAGVSVAHFAVDLFVDMPLLGGDCLNAYASLTRFDYGEDFVSRWAATGNHAYAQVGYKPRGSKLMPYLAAQLGDYDGFRQNTGVFDFGVNYFIAGHNAKLTAELHQVYNDPREGGTVLDPATGLRDPIDVSQVRVQAHFFF